MESKPLADRGAFCISIDLELAWIDPWTGGLARQDCLSPMLVPFVHGSMPRQVCSRDHAADWADYYARAYDVPLEFVQAVIDVESAWHPYVISTKGAVGLMHCGRLT